MKVLIVGGKGQLGRALAASAPADADIISHDVDTLDITDPDGVAAFVREVRPDWIFNAAAYTAVDKAESDEATALAVNATAVAHLAAAATIGGKAGFLSKPRADPATSLIHNLRIRR